MFCGLAVFNLKEGLKSLPPLSPCCRSCVVCANARRVIITESWFNMNTMMWVMQRQF